MNGYEDRDKFDNDPDLDEDSGRDEFSATKEMQPGTAEPEEPKEEV